MVISQEDAKLAGYAIGTLLVMEEALRELYNLPAMQRRDDLQRIAAQLKGEPLWPSPVPRRLDLGNHQTFGRVAAERAERVDD